MTDLSSLHQQQPVQPNLAAPVAIAAAPMQVNGAVGIVVVQVSTVYGQLVLGMPAGQAVEVGNHIGAAGKAASTGLTIVGGIGG